MKNLAAGCLEGRRADFAPGSAAVGRCALADAVGRAHQRPKAVVASQDEHGFVALPRGDGHVGLAEQRKRLARVRRANHADAALAAPQRRRQEPLAVGQGDGFVHHDPVAEPPRPRPGGLLDARAFGHDRPGADRAVGEVIRLCPEQPQPPLGIVPKAGVERADFAGRVDHKLDLRPSPAVVAAGGEHDEVFGPLVLAAAVPHGPEPPVGRPFQSGDALESPRLIAVLGTRRRMNRRHGEHGVLGPRLGGKRAKAGDQGSKYDRDDSAPANAQSDGRRSVQLGEPSSLIFSLPVG